MPATVAGRIIEGGRTTDTGTGTAWRGADTTGRGGGTTGRGADTTGRGGDTTGRAIGTVGLTVGVIVIGFGGDVIVKEGRVADGATAGAVTGLTAEGATAGAVTGLTAEGATGAGVGRTTGADAVGMSTVQECIAARHLGMEVFGISIITDMAVREENSIITHEEVLQAAKQAEPKLALLFKELVAAI